MRGNNNGSVLKFARIRYAIFFMIIIIICGTLGFMIIEKASFINSIFMTIITISTVGYYDVISLDIYGKIFTIFLILVSWITFAYSVSVITSHFVEGELSIFMASYRNKSKLKRMKEHVIIVGFGRNGKNAVEFLISHKTSFVVIEKSHEIIMENISKEIHFLEGDATEDNILKEAHIENARALITTLPFDADNLFITISAKGLNPNINIVARSSGDITSRKLVKAGASKAVMPESVGGQRMAMLVNQPDVVNFFDKISNISEAETNLVEIMCDNLPEELLNHSIYDLGIRNNTGANIIGYKTHDGEFIINPPPDTKMISNTKLFVLGTPQQISKMKKMLNFV